MRQCIFHVSAYCVFLVATLFLRGPPKCITGFNCTPYEKKEVRSVLKAYYGRKPLTPPFKNKPPGEGVHGAVYGSKEQCRVAFTENSNSRELLQYTMQQHKKSRGKLEKNTMKTMCKMQVQSPQTSLEIYQLHLDIAALSSSIAT